MSNSEDTLNKQFGLYELNERDVDPNPIIQFRNWYQEALSADLIHPNAFTLATSTNEEKPSARVVLLKDFDEHGFVFYTNSSSKKGHELSNNPCAAMCFWWGKLERQVRIEGSIQIVSVQEANEYFASRPRGSQIGAWASEQSSVISGREILDDRFKEFEDKYKDQAVPRPPYWNGYRLVAETIEFWQGRDNRLHDRLVYTHADEGSWKIERLAP
ncbi:MAG: pyridoxamine 5'-phosphate oxidase [Thermodesulfobacteriota bacterium]